MDTHVRIDEHDDLPRATSTPRFARSRPARAIRQAHDGIREFGGDQRGGIGARVVHDDELHDPGGISLARSALSTAARALPGRRER
jgi:hypothetical protein